MTSGGVTTDLIEIPERWEGLEGVFGGYVLALVAESFPVGAHRLVTCSLRFHARVDLGSVERTIRDEHRGATTSWVRIELHQSGRRVASADMLAIAGEGEPDYRGRPERRPASSPDELPPRIHLQGDLAFDRHLDVRCEPDFTIDTGGGCWLRLKGEPEDMSLGGPIGAVCVLLDGLMPAPFAREDPPWFVPTIEFSLSLAPAAAEWSGGWVWGTNRTEWMTENLCSELSTLADADGRFLAGLRQVRGIRYRPAEGRAPTPSRSES